MSRIDISLLSGYALSIVLAFLLVLFGLRAAVPPVLIVGAFLIGAWSGRHVKCL